ncbi:MAG: exo-alpha-sialidase [Opitutaceae bacterium]|nr:exo-alpha-sialidase [Opitutaceae bacterium]
MSSIRTSLGIALLLCSALLLTAGPRVQTTVDLSADAARQVVIAQGTPTVYQGHPTTVLLPDGKTMYCVWTYEHGGFCGPMKRSDDGGLNWSSLLPVPESWRSVVDCPTIFRLADPEGKYRLVVYTGGGPDGSMYRAHSEDDGRSWTEMESTHLPTSPSTDHISMRGGMPFTTVVPIHGGRALLGMTNIRRPRQLFETKVAVTAGSQTWEPWKIKVALPREIKTNILAQSISTDGGLTWAPWTIALDLPDVNASEPWIIRSPDGKELLCLIRENGTRVSLQMISTDEGNTWSKPVPLPPGLYGDRHVARYAADGRLVICFRDTGRDSATKDHFIAWVGSYDDIKSMREGQYRIKLLHSHNGSDCGYPGLELLPDGTFVATTYVKYRPGPERSSVVSVRFKLAETDRLAQLSAGIR